MTRPRRTRTGTAALLGEIAAAEAARPGRRGPFVVLVTTVVVATLTALLVLNTLAAADELEQQNIADSTTISKAQVQELQVDLADRSAPVQLARAAAALGMVPATSPAFLEVDARGRVRLLGQPGAASAPPIALPPLAGGATALQPGATPSATASPATPPSGSPAATASGSPSPGATPSSTARPGASPTVTVTLPGGAR